jgi:hypothetical protein
MGQNPCGFDEFKEEKVKTIRGLDLQKIATH